MSLEATLYLRLASPDFYRPFVLEAQFSVAQGEILGLLGPSGSGKSMTLKCIAGIVRPERGHVRLNDRVLFDSGQKIDLPSRERRVGYLFQSYALFPHMSARENVSFAVTAGYRRRHETVPQKKAVAALAQQELARLGIAHLAHARPRMLSGGERQRLALARALAAQPSVLLLDEPFSALDRKTREEMWRIVRELKTGTRLSLVLVTHDHEEAQVLADRILQIDRGLIHDDA